MPTVALYSSDPDDPDCPHWLDFDPRPLECAATERKMLERVMASFTAEECQRLESAVRQIPHIAPGLYMLTNHEWKNVRGFKWTDVLSSLAARLDGWR